MSKLKDITHEGTIKAINQTTISIEIVNNSMCESCHAQKLCSSAESKIKMIEVIKPMNRTYQIGDIVLIEGSSSMGLRAVLWSYIIPIIIILGALFITKKIGLTDGIGGLISLSTLIPYYFILYLFREKLQKILIFKIKQ